MGDAQSERIARTIREWQTRLLQLDRRNGLLYFKPRSSAVQIVDITPDELEDRLRSARGGLAFDYAERLTPRPSVTDPHPTVQLPAVHVTPGAIKSSVEPIALQARLRTLWRKAREWEEEQGINVLFVAAGFLEWVDVDGETARSPLLLLPCSLSHASARDPYYLIRDGDDIASNATLQHHLRETFGIELPEFDHDSLESYFETISQLIARHDEWSITRELFLSTFSYSKLAMWEDLERMRTEGIEHELIRRLAGAEDEAKGQVIAPALPPDEALWGGRLDDLLDVRDQFTILPADFSQLRAIHAARVGVHLVIHGPPGTGKSQTIANIIATLLADGQRVLFVSEKTAALDVVKRRLIECGLGLFALDLHSERGKKASVYDQFRASLGEPPTVQDPGLSYEALEQRRSQLNGAVRALHAVRQPLGLTAYEVHGRYADVQEYPRVDFPIRDIGALDGERLERVREVAGRIERRPGEFRDHAISRWRPLRGDRTSIQLVDDIRGDVERISSCRSPDTDVLGLYGGLA